MSDALKVIVVQMGARHGYAVPRMLYRRGALSCLYTDLCLRGAAPGAALSALLGVDHRLASGLRRRTVTEIPFALVYSAPMVNLRSALAFSRNRHERYMPESEWLSRRMMRWGTDDANVVYAMLGSGLSFWRHAKDRGLKISVDFFITPLWFEIIKREREAFLDWEPPTQDDIRDREVFEKLVCQTIEVADLLVCPAPAVVDGLTQFVAGRNGSVAGCPRCVVVPYGAPLRKAQKSHPVPGRVLFAGGADLRKGVHYLAKAAQSLKGSGAGFEFRIAGRASERVRGHPGARALTFLGHLSRERLTEEYRTADVFVLPTLAEGSAGVIYEALAWGVPIVTTRSAGSVVTDGREGLIVPERDSSALAAALERVVRDRSLRQAMSDAAYATAAEFDEEPWGDRLVAALSTLRGKNA